MNSIEEEMSRFEEEIMSLTQDVTSSGGTASKPQEKSKTVAPGFQPRQTQVGSQGVPRAPGFQPRQAGRPGGNMPHNRPPRPPGPRGFIPHQVRANRFHGPPRFSHLPPPPPPPMPPGGPMGPMPHDMGPPRPPGPPHPDMMGNMGPLPPPPLPPFAMMPPAPPPMNAPPSKPVTLSAKPTTYASKPVLNKKKKKVKKEKSADTKEDEKEAKPTEATPSGLPQSVPNPAPIQTSIPAQSQDRLPPPPPVPQGFISTPAVDLSQATLPQGGAYELPTASEPLKKKDKKKKFVRTAAGMTWEDESLIEWDPNDFRLFAGDLGNEVTEDTLTKVFGTYPSFLKCKIVRDKRTNKTKGYGFISFKDPRDFVQAMKDWNGKYVGNRPIKLLKSTWKDRDVNQVRKKQKEKDRLGLR